MAIGAGGKASIHVLCYAGVFYTIFSVCGFRVFQRGVNEILDIKPLVNSPENPAKLTSLKGHICFSEVIFSYEDDTPVLNNINFDIHPGKTVALIGPSGAGKSTTVQLLLRFFDPQSGKIQ